MAHWTGEGVVPGVNFGASDSNAISPGSEFGFFYCQKLNIFIENGVSVLVYVLVRDKKH